MGGHFVGSNPIRILAQKSVHVEGAGHVVVLKHSLDVYGYNWGVGAQEAEHLLIGDLN